MDRATGTAPRKPTAGAPRAAATLRTAVAARRLPTGLALVDAVGRLRGDAYPWWLDSARPGPPRGRFSFAGSDPYLVLRARAARVDLECRRAVRPDLELGVSSVEHDALDVARELLPPPPGDLDGAPALAAIPFVGGAVGYWGYELVEQLEPVRLHGRDDLRLPDLVLLYVDQVLVCDHATGEVRALGLGFAARAEDAHSRAACAADALASRLAEPAVPAAPGSGSERPIDVAAPVATAPGALPDGVRAHFDEGTYAKAVGEVLDEIAAGNVYQADLTHRLDVAWEGDPWPLYRALRRISPAPFAAYLGLPEAAVLSSSPERFLRVEPDGRVESRPIKGTRPRGAAPAEDARLRRELAASEKDRAENLMIVDLVRNDLGRACAVGSVAVPELMVVEDYATVFQLVSSVTGRLAPGRDATDLLRACFPPGSMTGAPKIAAMRLLDRLEPVRRGVYSGAIGYLDLRGGADLSVVIRTLIVAGGRAWLHVGGGVVADSDPRAEWRETLDKAHALLLALAECGPGHGDGLRAARPPSRPTRSRSR